MSHPENLLEFVDILQQELIRAGVLSEDYDFEAHKKLVPMQPGDVPVDVVNNVWLFIPFGTGLYAIFRKKRVWIAALALSVTIELIQYFTGWGIAELDDLFGNTLGGVIGVWGGVAMGYVQGKWRRKERAIRYNE